MVTCLVRPAQYVVTLHYHESALLTCAQFTVCQGFHLPILSQSVSGLRIGDWVILRTYSWVQSIDKYLKSAQKSKAALRLQNLLSTSSRELFSWH